MSAGVEVRLGPGDRERLEAVVASWNDPQKHVAGADRAAERGWRRDDGDPVAHREGQADDLALAETVH